MPTQRPDVFRRTSLEAPGAAPQRVRSIVQERAVQGAGPQRTPAVGLGSLLAGLFTAAADVGETYAYTKAAVDADNARRAEALKEQDFQHQRALALQNNREANRAFAAEQRDAMKNAEEAQRAAAKQKAETDKLEGTRSALVGSEAPADASKEYMSARKRTLGQNQGISLAAEYNSIVQTLPVDTNLPGHRDQWLMQKFGHAGQLGTGDSEYDVSLLETFRRMTDPVVGGAQVGQVKAVLKGGLQEKQAAIAAGLMSLHPEDIMRELSDFKSLSPLDPEAAPANLANSIITAVGNNPTRAKHALSILRQSEFDELHPESMRAIEDKIYGQLNTVRSLEADEGYTKISDQISQAEKVTDVLDIIAPGGALDAHYEQNGGISRRDQIRQNGLKILEKAAEKQAIVKALDNGLRDPNQFDPDLWRKHADEYMQAAGIDPMEDPAGAAKFLSRANYIVGDQTKERIGRALNTTTDATAFAKAARFVQAAKAAGGDPALSRLLDEDAEIAARFAIDQMELSGKHPEQIFNEWATGRNELSIVGKTSWSTLTHGKADDSTVLKRMQKQLSVKLGADVTLSPALEQRLLNQAKTAFVGRQNGLGDWSTSADIVTSTAVDRLTIHPTPSGLSVTSTAIPSTIIATHNDGTQVVDAKGNPVRVAVMGFGKSVVNPNTGQAEDTLATWDMDKQILGKTFPDFGRMGTLGTDPRWIGTKGAYAITDAGGNPIVLEAGRVYKDVVIDGKKQDVTIPTDPKAASEFLQKLDFGYPTREGVGIFGDLGGGPRIAKDIINPRVTSVRPTSDRLRFIPMGHGQYMMGYVPGSTSREEFPTPQELEATRDVKNQQKK